MRATCPQQLQDEKQCTPRALSFSNSVRNVGKLFVLQSCGKHASIPTHNSIPSLRNREFKTTCILACVWFSKKRKRARADKCHWITCELAENKWDCRVVWNGYSLFAAKGYSPRPHIWVFRFPPHFLCSSHCPFDFSRLLRCHLHWCAFPEVRKGLQLAS